MARHDFQHVDPVDGHVIRDGVGIESPIDRQHVQRTTGTERTEDRGVAEICRDRGERRETGHFIERETRTGVRTHS